MTLTGLPIALATCTASATKSELGVARRPETAAEVGGVDPDLFRRQTGCAGGWCRGRRLHLGPV